MRSLKELLLYVLKSFKVRGVRETLIALLKYIYRTSLLNLLIVFRLQIFAAKFGKNIKAKSEDGLAVLFIYVPTSPSRQLYRVTNQREQLLLKGIEADTVSTLNLDLLNYINQYNVFIFYRVPYSKIMATMVNKIQHSGKLALYDIDDLVFVPHSLKHSTPIDRKLVKQYKAMLAKCDYFLVTTSFLANILREEGKQAYVSRNCLNLEQIRNSEEARESRLNRDRNRVRIGYFSGTYTHDRDFLEASKALVYIMNKYQHVDLYIAGPLELSHELNIFKDRIKRLPFVEWRKLPFNIAAVDINLAPLEKGNPFSEGKSELKYFEAGILGIPTIASPTESFKFAIKHGENGMLASKPEDWVQCLELLITDETERRRIGENAREHVRMYYNPYDRGEELINTLQHIMEEVSL